MGSYLSLFVLALLGPAGFWVIRPYVFKGLFSRRACILYDFVKNSKKWSLWKTWSKKKMLDTSGYVFPSGGVLSIICWRIACVETPKSLPIWYKWAITFFNGGLSERSVVATACNNAWPTDLLWYLLRGSGQFTSFKENTSLGAVPKVQSVRASWRGPDIEISDAKASWHPWG